METTLMCFLYYLFIIICYCFSNSVVHAIESPKYIVIQSESDFQIRLYNESSWISAPSSGTNSFEQSTKTGFHRFYFCYCIFLIFVDMNIRPNQMLSDTSHFLNINSKTITCNNYVPIRVN